jgi:hypothetical protein
VRRGYDYGRGAYYTKFLLNRQSRGVYLRQWCGCSPIPGTASRLLKKKVEGIDTSIPVV